MRDGAGKECSGRSTGCTGFFVPPGDGETFFPVLFLCCIEGE